MILNLKDYPIEQGVVQTRQIQAVLDEATRLGGAVVVVPAGLYVTGTLDLGSASLHLEKGAVLKGSGDWADYRHNGFRHNEMHETISLLYSMGHDDITIDGDGVIDLNAEAFYHMDRPNVPDDGHEYSEQQKAECTRTYDHRPTQPIFFYDCRHVTVRGITIRNAPCWTLAFHSSEDIHISGLTIDNDMTIPNNDGMHFCGCRNVLIRDCNIKAGDDCIALSGITNWERPCENVTVSNCVMTSVSKAISIGYMHSIVRNVTISNCMIYEAQRGVALMASKGTGLVEHVLIDNLRIDTHIRAGNWWGNGEPICLVGTFHHYDRYLDPVPDRNWPVNIRDVHFSHISCTGENVIGVIGSGENIEHVVFDDLYFAHKESANKYLKGERCIDVSPSVEKIELPEGFKGCVYVRESRDVQLRNVTVQ